MSLLKEEMQKLNNLATIYFSFKTPKIKGTVRQAVPFIFI
jgi:hypothetical protein